MKLGLQQHAAFRQAEFLTATVAVVDNQGSNRDVLPAG
jgi:hypothetical protein